MQSRINVSSLSFVLVTFLTSEAVRGWQLIPGAEDSRNLNQTLDDAIDYLAQIAPIDPQTQHMKLQYISDT